MTTKLFIPAFQPKTMPWYNGQLDIMVPAESDEPGSTRTVEQFSFLLFLQVIVVKIPSIILSRRENANKSKQPFATYSTRTTA